MHSKYPTVFQAASNKLVDPGIELTQTTQYRFKVGEHDPLEVPSGAQWKLPYVDKMAAGF